MIATATPEETQLLWERYSQSRSEELRNQLVEIHLDYVGLLIKLQFASSLVKYDDLYQAGALGLIEAVEKYDVSLGYQFTTFAPTIIRGRILDSIRDQDEMPRAVRRANSYVEQSISRYRSRNNGNSPASDVLRDIIRRDASAPKRSISAIMADAKLGDVRTVKLEDPLGYRNNQGEPQTYQDVIEDRNTPDPSNIIDYKDLWANALTAFTRAEKLLIILYYRDGLTMKVVGETVGLSESRISQVHASIIARLRARGIPFKSGRSAQKHISYFPVASKKNVRIIKEDERVPKQISQSEADHVLCQYCQQPLAPDYRHNQKYCSKRCKNAVYNIRKRLQRAVCGTAASG